MNREVHVRIWERPEVRVLWATRQEDQFTLSSVNGRCGSDAVLRTSPPSPVSGLNRTFGSVATGPPKRRLRGPGEPRRSAISQFSAQGALDQVELNLRGRG